jgi:hypothetical protein
MTRTGSLPPEVTFVVGLDVAAFTATPFWRTHGNELMSPAKRDLDELKAGCDLDPVRDVRWALLALDGGGEFDHGVMLVGGAFDKAKIDRCLSAMRIPTTRTVDGITQHGKIWLGWAGPNTLMIAGDDDALPFMGKIAAGKGAPNPNVARMLARVPSGSTFWVAGELTQAESPAKDFDIVEQDLHAVAAVGSVRMAADLDANLAIEMATAGEAGQLIEEWQKRLGEARQKVPLLSAIKIAVAANTATVSLHLDGQMVELFGGMLMRGTRDATEPEPPTDDPPPPEEEVKPDDGD